MDCFKRVEWAKYARDKSPCLANKRRTDRDYSRDGCMIVDYDTTYFSLPGETQALWNRFNERANKQSEGEGLSRTETKITP